ncbi:DNA-binding protein RFX5-like protein, partial [Euroglyphus maynei]
ADIEKFNDIEKLYLYLQLPDGGNNNHNHSNNGVDDVGSDEISNGKKKTINNSPFGKKADSEVIQTYAWIQSHLEEDISVSIPKHEVYEEYRAYCDENNFEKLCVADFGKAMKHIFPQVKPRRLGQRGNSKYCYSGLRKKIIVTAPELPVLETSNDNNRIIGNNEWNEPAAAAVCNVRKNNVMVNDIVWNIILEWVEKTFNKKFKTGIDLARYLMETQNIKSDLDTVLSSNGNCLSQSMNSETSTNKLTNGKKISLSPIGLKIKSLMNDKKKCSSEILSNTQQQINNASMIGNSKISTIDTAAITTSTATISGNSFTTIQPPKNNVMTTAVITNIPEMVPVCNAKTVKILLSPHPQNQQQQQQQQQLPTSTLQTVPSQTCFMIDQQQQLLNTSNENFKYKPIQPKPVNFDSMSRFRPMTSNVPSTIAFIHNEQLVGTKNGTPTATTVALLNCNSTINEGDKVNGQQYEDNNNVISNSKLTDKNYKRQIDNVEKEITFMMASKKRHVETKNIGQNNMEPKLSTTDICDLK